ncbi:MAG TPA: MAPEG family protein [Polyangiaceae bacterium]
MSNLASNPAFLAYSVSLLVLSLNLLVLWGYSGGVRAKSKTTPNAEDAAGATKLLPDNPPEVARVLRAHANAMANIVPFAIVGLLYVLAGGSGMAAAVLFGVFTFARLAHSFAYLGGKQPWRTLSFALGAVTTLVLMGYVVRALVVV